MANNLNDLRSIIKERGLKIRVSKNADPDKIWEKIQEQIKEKEETPSPLSEEKKNSHTPNNKNEQKTPSITSPEGSPDCFGEYVFAGAKKCRVCWFAQGCKKVSK